MIIIIIIAMIIIIITIIIIIIANEGDDWLLRLLYATLSMLRYIILSTRSCKLKICIKKKKIKK